MLKRGAHRSGQESSPATPTPTPQSQAAQLAAAAMALRGAKGGNRQENALWSLQLGGVLCSAQTCGTRLTRSTGAGGERWCAPMNRNIVHVSHAMQSTALREASSFANADAPFLSADSQLYQAVWLTRDAQHCEDLSLVGEGAFLRWWTKVSSPFNQVAAVFFEAPVCQAPPVSSPLSLLQGVSCETLASTGFCLLLLRPQPRPPPPPPPRHGSRRRGGGAKSRMKCSQDLDPLLPRSLLSVRSAGESTAGLRRWRREGSRSCAGTGMSSRRRAKEATAMVEGSSCAARAEEDAASDLMRPDLMRPEAALERRRGRSTTPL